MYLLKSSAADCLTENDLQCALTSEPSFRITVICESYSVKLSIASNESQLSNRKSESFVFGWFFSHDEMM